MHSRLLPVFCTTLAVLPHHDLPAQRSRSHLGLAATGAVESYAGVARVQRGMTAAEVGASLDVGWLGSPRVRLVGDVSLVGSRRSDIDPADTLRYSSAIYDLSAGVGTVVLGGAPTSRVTPYASLGVGVHALASTFKRVNLDAPYNGNRFGIDAAVGLRTWLSPSGRAGAFLEARRTYVLNMNRWGVRAGATLYFADLRRPASERQPTKDTRRPED
jgi:hypothetical protein